jgi:hypothetical protein
LTHCGERRDACFNDTGEAEDGGPFAVSAGLPDDVAVEEGCDGGGRQVAVEVEEFGVGPLVEAGEVKTAVRRNPLGGEDERGVVAAGVGRGLLDLGEGEVVDGVDFDRDAGVAEVGMLKLGGGGPGGEDRGLGEALRDEMNGLLMEDDHVAVGEVILRGEGVGRVDAEVREKGDGGEHGEPAPADHALLPDRDADQQDQGIERQEVAREQRAAQHGEGQGVAQDDDAEGREDRLAERTGGSLGAARHGEHGDRADHRNVEVHVQGEVYDAMPEAEQDARGGEVGGGVVAEELGIAEEEAGCVKMVGVPERERDDGEEEDRNPGACEFGCGWLGPGRGDQAGQLPEG